MKLIVLMINKILIIKLKNLKSNQVRFDHYIEL